MLPPGPKIAFTGGLDFNDHRLIWDKLDQVRAKHPNMVLLHGGSPKGAERIASRWADHRKCRSSSGIVVFEGRSTTEGQYRWCGCGSCQCPGQGLDALLGWASA